MRDFEAQAARDLSDALEWHYFQGRGDGERERPYRILSRTFAYQEAYHEGYLMGLRDRWEIL